MWCTALILVGQKSATTLEQSFPLKQNWTCESLGEEQVQEDLPF